MVDFIELAQVSLYRFRQSLGSVDQERYVNTLYVAISENNEVICSYDSAILGNAYQCIIIHCKSVLAITNWHSWYKPEFINRNGYNLGEILGNDCSIRIKWEGSWSNQVLKLYQRDEELYSGNAPFENHMQSLWNAYCNTLNNANDSIEYLQTIIAQKEERIHVLQEQLIQYKNVIDGIRVSLSLLGE